jgi:hypothetical protein
VHEEAQAAVNAAGLDATLAHLALATAYARRLRAQIPGAAASAVPRFLEPAKEGASA